MQVSTYHMRTTLVHLRCCAIEEWLAPYITRCARQMLWQHSQGQWVSGRRAWGLKFTLCITMLSHNLTVMEALSDCRSPSYRWQGALRRNHGAKNTLRTTCLTKIAKEDPSSRFTSKTALNSPSGSQEKSAWPTKSAESALTDTVVKDKGTRAIATA